MKGKIKEIAISVLLVVVATITIELVYTAYVTIKQSGYKGWPTAAAMITESDHTVRKSGKALFYVEWEYYVDGKSYKAGMKTENNLGQAGRQIAVLYNPNNHKQCIPAAQIQDPFSMLKMIPYEALYFGIGAAIIFFIKAVMERIIGSVVSKKQLKTQSREDTA